MPKEKLLPLPIKGINKYAARADQPQFTTPRALNVIPFDRQGRQRIAQRPGTGKLWETAIGSGNMVQFLQQTAIGVGGDTFIATSVDDSFTYSDGQLDSVSSGAWNSNILGAGGVETDLVVSSGQLRSTTEAYAQIVPSPTAATSYVITTTVTIDAGTLQSGDTIGVFYRKTGTGQERFEAIINRTSGTVAVYLRRRNSAGSITDLDSDTVANTAGAHELKVTVDGNVHNVYWDGVLIAGPSTDATFSSAVDLGVVFVGDPAASLDNFLYGTEQRSALNRRVDIVAVANGGVYMGDFSEQATLVTGGSSLLGTTTRPSGAALFGKMYLVDGEHDIRQIDIEDRASETFTPTAGTETATTLGKYTLAASWRGRLVLAHDVDNPQNFTMSKVGDPHDFDYTGTGEDTAFAGNASTLGQIGDPITALIPGGDDTLILGTDHHLHIIRGDPAAGGSIDLLSDAIGILGQSAWTKSPDGTIYFVGTTGLFAMAASGGAPVQLTSKIYNQFFTAINRQTSYVSLQWDRDRHACYIFVTPVVSGTATHLYYDVREGGLWELQYPNSHGPVSVTYYDADDDTDRFTLLGGRTGYVQITSDTNRRDDGTSISANFYIGPFQPFAPMGACVVTQLNITGGEVSSADVSTVWNMNWELFGGDTAYKVTDGTADISASGSEGTDGRIQTIYPRIYGGWFALKLSNTNDGDYFSVDQVSVIVEEAGRIR